MFTPSHTCTVSFFLLVGEENDNFDECACVKRMETQDIDTWILAKPQRDQSAISGKSAAQASARNTPKGS